MTLRLDSVRAKMARANAHVRELEEMLRPILEPTSNRFVREDHGDATKPTFKVVDVPKVEPTWAVIVGEVFYNLRSAYDHLANQLVRLDTKKPTRDTAFPIRRSRTDQSGNTRVTNLKPAVSRQDILDCLDAVQPYSVDPAHPENSFLWVIGELGNIDKHRALLVMVSAVDFDRVYWGFPDGVPSPAVKMKTGPIKDGDTVAWFDFHGTEAPPDFDAHMALTVRLDEGPTGNIIRSWPLVDLLSACVEQIAGDMNFKGFAHLFDEYFFDATRPFTVDGSGGWLPPQDLAVDFKPGPLGTF